MIPPLVLSLDLDDTLWPVAPVIAAAEDALWSFLRERHPELMRAHGRETLRALHARVAAAHPDRLHDMTFMRRRTLVELFASTPRAEALADEAFEIFYAARNRVRLEGHVTAISAGHPKPDARIFAQLLERAGVLPAQVLHIGDDPHADVVGATRAGMQAAWINRDAREWPVEFAPPPRTIATLAEIS